MINALERILNFKNGRAFKNFFLVLDESPNANITHPGRPQQHKASC